MISALLYIFPPPQEMYDWGKRAGWEPVIWKDGQPHPAPQQVPGVAAAAGGGAAAYGGGGPGPHQGQHAQHAGYGGQQQQQQHRGNMHGGQRGGSMGRR